MIKMLPPEWVVSVIHTPSQSFLTASLMIVIEQREHSNSVIMMHVSNSCTCSTLQLLPAA